MVWGENSPGFLGGQTGELGSPPLTGCPEPVNSVAGLVGPSPFIPHPCIALRLAFSELGVLRAALGRWQEGLEMPLEGKPGEGA